MKKTEVTVGIGGAAGDGIASTGDVFTKTCARLGLHLYAYNSYQSVIRGGHVWLRCRISPEKVTNHGDHLDLVVALNQDTVNQHALEVAPGGGIIYNSDKIQLSADHMKEGVHPFPLPINELTKPFGSKPIMQNTVALGAVTELLNIDFEVLSELLRETFGRKGEAVVTTNIGVAKAGYEYAKAHFPDIHYDLKFGTKHRMVLTGNEAISVGAVAAGCKFYSAYPMTPASGILHWMAAHAEKCDVVVKQCEDEISVMNMAIGAGHAGVRAMCGSSGGGFALMTEAVGMASMLEVPVVIVEVQRGGPSTGLPTKQEQGDLNQVVGASQGDFPRVILSAGTVEDCFNMMPMAFNWAERYQLPVLVMSDLLLAEHHETVDPEAFDFNQPIDRGALVTSWSQNGAGPKQYDRYAITENGVSPRALPGLSNDTLYVAASDEHDEHGIVISDVFTNPVMRKKMMEKRMRKIDFLAKEIPGHEIWGDPNADITFVTWGSTAGVVREAIGQLAKEGIKANNLQILYIWPFPAAQTKAILERCKRVVAVEANFSAQMARHIAAETGFMITDKILKYDGEPFEPHHIVEEVKAKLLQRV